MQIHKSSIVEDGVTLGQGVTIGPFCHIRGNVVIGDGTKLHSHVVMDGDTQIGRGCEIYPFASVGLAPQDLKYHGEESRLVIGDNTRIREHVTIHRGTKAGNMETRIGSNCLIMVGAHVAHDCIIHDNVILVNNVTLAGHVEVEEYAIIGGLSAVHQFVRIGKHAMIGGMSGIESDVVPYGSAMGERAGLAGLNLVGLKRRGFDREEIHALRSAYRMLFAKEGTMRERIEDVREHFAGQTLVEDVLKFITYDNSRSICLPKETKE